MISHFSEEIRIKPLPLMSYNSGTFLPTGGKSLFLSISSVLSATLLSKPLFLGCQAGSSLDKSMNVTPQASESRYCLNIWGFISHSPFCAFGFLFGSS